MARASSDPLVFTERITDEQGRPTEYFLRQWISQGIGSKDAAVLIEALIARNLIAGVALAGGGDLSADRTFDLEDTAVAPAQYGDAANVAQITIDQQGRITAAADVAVAGVGAISKASASFAGELVLTTQTEVATVVLTKNGAATVIVLKLNYEAMNELLFWFNTAIQFSNQNVFFSGEGGQDTLLELVVKVDTIVNGISNFIQTSRLYATKFIEIIIIGVATGARTISVELNPQSTTRVRQRQITVLEL